MEFLDSEIRPGDIGVKFDDVSAFLRQVTLLLPNLLKIRLLKNFILRSLFKYLINIFLMSDYLGNLLQINIILKNKKNLNGVGDMN